MRRLGYLDPAEAFRYRVTSSPDALNNALKSVDAIKGLIGVTLTNLRARCRIAIGSPFAAGWTWIGNTSRDQYCGVIFGLGIACELIPLADSQAVIRDAVTRMVTRF